ncbi:MAG: ABC transporter substrate-binding protein [Alphaproteobacteria bacterium]|nr:ABC transporter substrate-binding protein [Alphaproteobacteria bacterium]
MRMSSTLTRRVALLSASALIACGALLGAATPAAAEKVKIVLPTPPNTFGVPHYIAEDKGWYKEQGLEIEELLVQGDATAFRTLMSGDGDFTLIGPSTAMNGYLKGAKVKVFGAWQSTVDYQLIGNKEKLSGKIDKTMEGKVMAGSGGVSMLNHMIAMVLKKHNLDASGLKNIAIGGHADRLAGVIAGKADMTLVSTLFAERAKDQIHWITNISAELGGVGYTYLVAREETLNNPERRKALTKLLTSTTRGARYAAQDPAFATAALHKRMPSLDPVMIRSIIDRFNAEKLWDLDGAVTDKVQDFTARTYFEYKEIERIVTPQEIIFKGITDDVAKELGKPQS